MYFFLGESSFFFFCYAVSAKGIEVDEEKVKSIKDWPTLRASLR